ncbi:hypothetical protein DMC30DRAFT_26062 [Rhodotorula diobovata]|uniref:Golgi apparatus membrane protein TVP38 n=1 Tax=Rhodotorula diobovata TaxID=5288 RepID=A0A5C5FRV6_9BASI|nr:hypothetical protein DMC30DRAFT_26062 [Rhodotorula diobovata]
MDTVRRLNELAIEYAEAAMARYHALSRGGKTVVLGMVGLNLLFFVAFWTVGPERIAEQFAALADQIAASPYGWAILFGIIIVTSVPPLIGYGTAQTLVGFAYGVWPGFLISASSCLGGGAFAFLVVRRFIRYFAPFLQRDSTHQALSRAVRAKGLPLMMMLRLAPFPYPYSNAFFASIETVTLGQFVVATLAITPKLLLHVFIGHRTYLFADPSSRHSMDPVSKWLNGAFLVVGTVLGAGTSWYLYRLTMRYVEEANAGAGVELGGEGEQGGRREDAMEAELLDEVDGMLDDEDNGAAQRGKGRASQDGWGDFADDDDDDEDEALTRDGVQGRRDSTAWGLDLDVDDEERGEPPKGRLRLD